MRHYKVELRDCEAIPEFHSNDRGISVFCQLILGGFEGMRSPGEKSYTETVLIGLDKIVWRAYTSAVYFHSERKLRRT